MVKKLKELSIEKRIAIKVLAVLLVIALTFTNVAILGKYLGEGLTAYATDNDINNQDGSTSEENVKFEAYLDVNNKGVKTIEKDITSDDVTLYVQVKVQGGGILKNGVVSFGDINFKLKEEVDQNKLNLDVIRSGESVTLEMPIKALTDGDKYNLVLLDLISTIKFTGKYTNNDGNEVEVNGEQKIKIKWNSNLAVETENLVVLTQDIITNKVYKIGEESKRVVQVLVKSGINKNAYPIKETIIETMAPVLSEEGATPDEVRVSTINGINSTNGLGTMVKETELEEGSFEANTWVYDSEENKLKIKSVNVETDNNITWKKDGLDEYIVTYVYPENTDMSLFKLELNSNLSLYGGENITVSGNNKLEKENLEELSNLTDINIVVTNSDSKGKINIGQAIEYITGVSMGVSYIDTFDRMTIIENSDTIYNKEKTAEYNKSIYKETYINKTEFINIFGEEGSIEIYHNGNELLYKIDNMTETDENGNIIIKYPNNVSGINIKTTKPEKEGRFNIIHKKEALVDGLTPEEIFDINVLKTKISLAGNKGTDEVEQKQAEADMKLENPVTVSKLGMDKTSLSTIKSNDVTFTITLKTDDIKYDLYKDPVFELEIPSHIKTVKTNEMTLINGNGLKAKAVEGVKTNKAGNKVLRIALEGEQKAYGADTKIVIKANLETERLMPDVDTEIKLRFENQKNTIYEKDSKEDIVNIKIQSEPGMILSNTVTDYAEEGSILTVIKDEVKAGRLGAREKANEVTYKGTIINNINGEAKNVLVLGRIPFEGNAGIKSGEDLGTTVNATLKTTVNVSTKGVKIYYSQNGEATADLESETNGWTEEATTASKSYLIVIDSMKERSKVEFSYNAEIPANLGKNQEVHTTYAAINGETVVEAPELKLATEKELDLKMETISSADTETVHVGERVTLDVKITNDSDTDVTNVTVKLPIPEGTIYVKREQTILEGDTLGHYVYNEYPDQKEIEVKIPLIKGGETKAVSEYLKDKYIVKVTELPEGQAEKAIEHTVVMTADDFANEIVTKTNFTAKKAMFTAEMMWANAYSHTFANEETDYCAKIVNISGETLHNLEYTHVIPEGLTYTGNSFVQIGENGQYTTLFNEGLIYDSNTRTITYKLNSLVPNGRIQIEIGVKGTLENGEISKIFICGGKIKADGVEAQRINTDSFEIVSMNMEIKDSSSASSKIVVEDTSFTHKISITNNGLRPLETINVELEMPQEVILVTSVPNQSAVNRKIEWSWPGIGVGETVELEVKVHARLLPLEIEDKAIDFKAKISGFNIEETIDYNTTYTIKATQDPTKPSNPETDTYGISGTAWLDENKDGAKGGTEKALKDINVKLIDAKTNNFVKDQEGKEIAIKTDENGRYAFTKITKGSYMVVFEFDYSMYEVTLYHKEGVGAATRSDAITTTTESGPITHTDKLEITNAYINNINIGLVELDVFDLKLDKYISKLTVTNEDGTVVREYTKDAGKMVKEDVRAKALNGTSVIVEYTIEITNEGEVPGTVKTIIDHMPPDMRFSSDMNPNWYEGPDRRLRLPRTWGRGNSTRRNKRGKTNINKSNDNKQRRTNKQYSRNI